MVLVGRGEEDKGRGEREGQLSSWEACKQIKHQLQGFQIEASGANDLADTDSVAEPGKVFFMEMDAKVPKYNQ